MSGEGHVMNELFSCIIMTLAQTHVALLGLVSACGQNFAVTI